MRGVDVDSIIMVKGRYHECNKQRCDFSQLGHDELTFKSWQQ